MKSIGILIVHLSLLACLLADYFFEIEGLGRIAQALYWIVISVGIVVFFSPPDKKQVLPSMFNHTLITSLNLITFLALLYCNWIFTAFFYIFVFMSSYVSRVNRYKDQQKIKKTTKQETSQ